MKENGRESHRGESRKGTRKTLLSNQGENCHSLGQTNSQYSMRMTMTTTMTTTINSFTSPEIEEMKEGGKMLTLVCDGE
jgi:hypothetical protein